MKKILWLLLLGSICLCGCAVKKEVREVKEKEVEEFGDILPIDKRSLVITRKSNLSKEELWGRFVELFSKCGFYGKVIYSDYDSQRKVRIDRFSSGDIVYSNYERGRIVVIEIKNACRVDFKVNGEDYYKFVDFRYTLEVGVRDKELSLVFTDFKGVDKMYEFVRESYVNGCIASVGITAESILYKIEKKEW